ncbi:MAG: SRPBCC family protein [Acidimicrobiales bacterium]|nr:SRPBCC family protein [Acidimicrobiales bacterium]MCB9393478.1 SRPBCC family protein [Acidimicrobiaceae bacterium]
MSSTSLSSKNHESVERVIAAPPEAIFDLLADPARHHDIDGSGTVQRAPEGSRRLQLGDRFGMDMKMGIGYSMVSEVVEFEENRRIAWQSTSPVKVLGLFVGGRIWRYELEPVAGGGTLVRETWDISKERLPAMVRPMRSKTKQNMEQTLERIEQLVTG